MRRAAIFALAATLWAVLPASGAGPSNAPQCKALFELYRTCYENGVEADSQLTCMEISAQHMSRLGAKLGRGSAANQALVELVCTTGCDDAVTRLERATQQEFTEAFCE